MDSQLASAISIFMEFLDALPQPVAIVDAAGNYVYYNEESAHIDDYQAAHALGNPVLQIYPQLNQHSSTLLQAAFKGKRYHNQYQLYYNPGGNPVHQVHTTLPLQNSGGDIIGAIEISRDLSVINHLHEQFIDLQQKLHGQQPPGDDGIVTCEPEMQKLIHQAQRLAKTDVQVLIYGETGTGKELFARLLHTHSERARQPFLVLNCAAMPEPLFESALFGTVKGAFTGAEDRKGLLESAHGGTLFLDELNSMPMAVQGKLLRALQEQTFRRVGSSQECRVDVRIIAATNESPQTMLDKQRIRPDLLYRLNVGYLTIPPLRERKRDIPLLAQAFLEKNGKITGNRVKRISPAVLERLQRHRWPGNVRMLENIILRSLIFCENGDELDFILLEEDEQQLEPLPPCTTTTALPSPPAVDNEASASLEAQVAAYERTLLLHYLKRYPNLSEAARQCGLPRATLQYKMKKYGIRLAQQVIDG
ncbi:sigma-54 interaction domain-containing protein [Aquitalea aquatica]|uniref:HTH-type transcriptional regulatory protein TyrR n=1 Tax=Aquitalea aquatica TaxID=3044273 RepID=A0A838YAH3_9NEIS|nr:sigma 54-interacting transcriptional regulator [Aquitalea magnusonii]MBA4710828.1 sigma 54-interacting transcriptional regulator [Aquitalea magnusonii]